MQSFDWMCTYLIRLVVDSDTRLQSDTRPEMPDIITNTRFFIILKINNIYIHIYIYIPYIKENAFSLVLIN